MNKRDILFVTTFNKSGYEKYGKKMLASFANHLPKSVKLVCFYEDFTPNEVYDNFYFVDLHAASKELVTFKNKWRNDPKANGYKTSTPGPTEKPDFKYDAVRFSHKVFALHAASKMFSCDYLIWIDGDTLCFDDLTEEFILMNCPGDMEVASYLGRPDHYTECGWVAYNMNFLGQQFLLEFAGWYMSEKIFKLQEWHDSWVFDRLRETFERNGYNFCNLTPFAGKGEHVFINSALGSKMDHMKGPRKDLGKSKKSDLKTIRSEKYWQEFNQQNAK